MQTTHPSSASLEWRAGWRVVCAAFIGNGLGFNLFLMSAGLFVIPLQKQLGLSRTEVMVSPIALMAVSLLSPVVARYLDRDGPRRWVLGSFGVLGVAYILLATMPPSAGAYYAITLLFVLGGCATATMAFCKGISLIFSKGAGLAFGVTMSGVSLVSAAIIPLLNKVITDYGWQAAYGLCALFVFAIGIPALFFMFRLPAAAPCANQTAEAPGFSLSVLKTPAFWCLAISVSFGTFCIGGLMTHFYPMLVSSGMNSSVAAAALSTYAIAIGAGRIVVGFLLDRFNPKIIACVCMTLPALGAVVLLLALSGLISAYCVFLAAFLMGWGQGAEGDFPAYFTLRLFGPEAFASVFSWLNIFAGGSLALGGLAFAFVFDETQTYTPMILATVIFWICAASAMMAVRIPSDR